MAATIDDLPDEILEQVLRLIPQAHKKKARYNLMLVSRKWNELAEIFMGLEVFIGTAPWSGWENSAGADHVEISKIQEFGISICHVGEILHYDDIRPKPKGLIEWMWGKVKDIFVSPPFPTFKHPHLLRSFRFSGIIRPEFFSALVSSSTTFNLRQIQFNHSSLSLLQSSSLANLDLQSLRYIEIMADFSYIFRDIDDSRILTNILTLLTNSFPSLTSVNLYLPFEHSRELELTKSFFRFLCRNARHLKYLEVFYFFMLTEDDELDDLLDSDSDNPGVLELRDEELDRIVEQAAANLRLRVVIAHINVDRMRCFHYWKKLMARQTALEYFVVLSEHQIFSESLIRGISNTIRVILGTVDTRGEDGSSTPLDCALFRDCHRLAHFSMKGRYEDFMLLQNSPGIINLESLPSSIRHMDLAKIPVLTSDLEQLLLNEELLPNLIHFVGKFLGRTGDMGVTLGVLLEVIGRRRLHWFHLAGSFNGMYPEDGLSNGHPSRPSLLYMEDDCVCAKLGKSGYYNMASPFDELLTNLSSHSYYVS